MDIILPYLLPSANTAGTCPENSQRASERSISVDPPRTTPESMANIYHAFCCEQKKTIRRMYSKAELIPALWIRRFLVEWQTKADQVK